MAIVFAQTGAAVDWDWASELTLWSSDADRLLVRLGTHQLLHRPASERQGATQAGHRWLSEGQWRSTPGYTSGTSHAHAA
jgi:hypothetical protein